MLSAIVDRRCSGEDALEEGRPGRCFSEAKTATFRVYFDISQHSGFRSDAINVPTTFIKGCHCTWV